MSNYDRKQLLSIGAEFVTFLGYAIDAPNRPIRPLKSDTDKQIEEKLITAMKNAEASGWEGADGEVRNIADASDLLLAFIYENDIISLQIDEEVQDEDEEEMLEEADDEEVLEETEEVEEVSGEDEDAELLAMQAQLEEEITLMQSDLDDDEIEVETEEDAEEETDPEETESIDDEFDDVDDNETCDVSEESGKHVLDPKIEEMVQLTGETPENVFSQYAPVTIQNVESAVITMTKLLAEGKVVVISAHEIGSVPFLQHSQEKVTVPVVEEQSNDAPDKDKWIESFVQEGLDRMGKRLRSEKDLKPTDKRKAYCDYNKLKPKGGKKATPRALYTAIMEHEETHLRKIAPGKYGERFE